MFLVLDTNLCIIPKRSCIKKKTSWRVILFHITDIMSSKNKLPLIIRDIIIENQMENAWETFWGAKPL